MANILNKVSLNKLQAEEKQLLLEEAKLENIKKRRLEIQSAIDLMEFYYEISGKANGPLSTPRSRMICSFFAAFPVFSLLEGRARLEHWAARYNQEADRDRNVKLEMADKPMALKRKEIFISEFLKDEEPAVEEPVVTQGGIARLRAEAIKLGIPV